MAAETAGAPTYPVTTIAKLLLLTERRVQQLTKAGVIPKSERGRYELAPAVQGYIRFLQERSIAGSGTDAALDYHAQKARKIKADADRQELALARSLEQVAPIADFERALTKMAAGVKAQMRQIPSRVTTLLIGETEEKRFRAVLLEEIDATLEQLAETELVGEGDLTEAE